MTHTALASRGAPACPYSVVVIGAGQAGLAAARTLTRAGLRPGHELLVLDANSGPGGAWRHRWPSLTLGRAHGIADLPGLQLGQVDPRVPAAEVVADYYGRYEQEFDLAVQRPARVRAVHTGPSPDLLTVTYDGPDAPSSVITRLLINATGTWTRPYVPHVPGIETFTGRQLHTVSFRNAEQFQGLRTVVVGGGLSAVQFLLQLAPVTDTVWATRRPPNFTDRAFDATWGQDVERAVRERTRAGQAPASVVRTTGIPLWPEYRKGVAEGVLVSRGMFERITPDGVFFPGTGHASGGTGDGGARVGHDSATRDGHDSATRDGHDGGNSRGDGGAGGLGPSAADHLVLPESWRPFQEPTQVAADVIFWNTGFRAALDHLAPLHLRSGGGIRMKSEVEIDGEERVLLVGYGSSASTIGATRAGRAAARVALRRLEEQNAA